MTLVGAMALGQTMKWDRAKALEDLRVIEVKNEKFTEDLLVKSAQDFLEASGEKIKAAQMVLESYRNVEFGRTQEGDTLFQQWKVDNKDRISSLGFTAGAQLHVQYLALVCRQALGGERKPKAGEWAEYWESLFESRNSSENPAAASDSNAKKDKRPGSVRKQGTSGWNDFERPLQESSLVRDRQIQGFLRQVKEAEVPSGSEELVFSKVVRPRLREAKSRDLLRLWDLRITSMDQEAEKEAKTLAADDYKVLKRPELLWERADDLEKIGEEEAAWGGKMEILKTNPYHPKTAEWITGMQQVLGDGSSDIAPKQPVR